jgi:hypothetical protein
MLQGGKECEVGFGALGAELNAVKQVDPKGVEAYQHTAIASTVSYLNKLDKNPKELTDPEYLSVALPLFLRSAYLRGNGKLDDDLIELDHIINAYFSVENCKEVSAMFSKGESASKELFKDSYKGATVLISNRSVTVMYKGRQVTTVFMPPK